MYPVDLRTNILTNYFSQPQYCKPLLLQFLQSKQFFWQYQNSRQSTVRLFQQSWHPSLFCFRWQTAAYWLAACIIYQQSEFSHSTASLFHSQSNVNTEFAAVRTDTLLKKAASIKENLWRANLYCRNTVRRSIHQQQLCTISDVKMLLHIGACNSQQ